MLEFSTVYYSIFNLLFQQVLLFLFLFRPRVNEDKYVLVKTGEDVCMSYVGMVPDKFQPQPLRLHDSCVDHPEAIQHEFLHAVGVFHTQARSDREKTCNNSLG